MDSTIELIIKIGGVAGAISAIIALGIQIKKVVNFFLSMKEDVACLLKHDREQYLSILRLTVMNSEMPISERLIAGKKYIENGGNGDVKHYYEDMLKKYENRNGE